MGKGTWHYVHEEPDDDSSGTEGEQYFPDTMDPRTVRLKALRIYVAGQRQWRHWGAGLAAAGVASMVLYAAVTAVGGGPGDPRSSGGAGGGIGPARPEPRPPGQPHREECFFELHGTCPVGRLLESPEVQGAAAGALLGAGRGGLLGAADGRLVRGTVQAVFSNTSAALLGGDGTAATPLAALLRRAPLDVAQERAVIAAMRLLADLRVQGVGLDVARAIRDSPSPERGYLRSHIEERLRPRAGEIQGLCDALVPRQLRELWGGGVQPGGGPGGLWAMTLEPENVRAMETVSREFISEFAPRSFVGLQAKREAVAAGALEETKLLLNLMRMHTRRLYPAAARAPWENTTTLHLWSSPLAWPCELGPAEENDLNFVKAMVCPLKFGAQGLDAMRATLLGRLSSSDPPRTVPMGDLFTSARVRGAAAENLVRLGGRLLAPRDSGMVERVAAGVFQNISAKLYALEPVVAHELERVQLNMSQRDAVLVALRLLTDARLQKVGIYVAEAIRASPSPSRGYLKKHIEGHLWEHVGEIEDLNRELIPQHLEELWGRGHPHDAFGQWEMTLEPENIQSMESATGEFVANFAQPRSMDPAVQRDAIFYGLLEEGRVLLDIMKIVLCRLGPAWVATMDKMDFGSSPLSWPCDEGVDHDPDMIFMKSMICPLKFGVQGLDAMRAASMGRLSRTPLLTARALLGSREAAELAAESLVRSGRGLLRPSDRGPAARIVREGLAAIVGKIDARAPLLATELDRITFSTKQKAALLRSIRLIGDSRVQHIGRLVAQAIQRTPSEDRDVLRDHITAEMQSWSGDARALARKLIPEELRTLWSRYGQERSLRFEMTLEPENIRSMASVSGALLTTYTPWAPVDGRTRRAAISYATLELGRVLLDILRIVIRQLGPTWDTSLTGSMDMVFRPLSWPCEVSGNATEDVIKALVCPLKYGAQGLDAIRAASE